MYLLRELERKDLSKINVWRNDPELISQLGAPFRYINSEVDEDWYNAYMSNRNNNVRCAIVQGVDDKLLGLISLTSVNWLNRSCRLQIMIGDKDNQNKGIGTFAIKKILEHAFENMNLQRVELYTLMDNKRAQHLYEKIGFVREGVKRKCVYKKGEYKDMILYAILREEWWGDRPKTHNPNLGVEAKANDMELYESKVDVTDDYKVNLKQKVGIANQEKIVFGQSVGG